MTTTPKESKTRSNFMVGKPEPLISAAKNIAAVLPVERRIPFLLILEKLWVKNRQENDYERAFQAIAFSIAAGEFEILGKGDKMVMRVGKGGVFEVFSVKADGALIQAPPDFKDFASIFWKTDKRIPVVPDSENVSKAIEGIRDWFSEEVGLKFVSWMKANIKFEKPFVPSFLKAQAVAETPSEVAFVPGMSGKAILPPISSAEEKKDFAKVAAPTPPRGTWGTRGGAKGVMGIIKPLTRASGVSAPPKEPKQSADAEGFVQVPIVLKAEKPKEVEKTPEQLEAEKAAKAAKNKAKKAAQKAKKALEKEAKAKEGSQQAKPAAQAQSNQAPVDKDANPKKAEKASVVFEDVPNDASLEMLRSRAKIEWDKFRTCEGYKLWAAKPRSNSILVVRFIPLAFQERVKAELSKFGSFTLLTGPYRHMTFQSDPESVRRALSDDDMQLKLIMEPGVQKETKAALEVKGEKMGPQAPHPKKVVATEDSKEDVSKKLKNKQVPVVPVSDDVAKAAVAAVAEGCFLASMKWPNVPESRVSSGDRGSSVLMNGAINPLSWGEEKDPDCVAMETSVAGSTTSVKLDSTTGKYAITMDNQTISVEKSEIGKVLLARSKATGSVFLWPCESHPMVFAAGYPVAGMAGLGLSLSKAGPGLHCAASLSTMWTQIRRFLRNSLMKNPIRDCSSSILVTPSEIRDDSEAARKLNDFEGVAIVVGENDTNAVDILQAAGTAKSLGKKVQFCEHESLKHGLLSVLIGDTESAFLPSGGSEYFREIAKSVKRCYVKGSFSVPFTAEGRWYAATLNKDASAFFISVSDNVDAAYEGAMWKYPEVMLRTDKIPKNLEYFYDGAPRSKISVDGDNGPEVIEAVPSAIPPVVKAVVRAQTGREPMPRYFPATYAFFLTLAFVMSNGALVAADDGLVQRSSANLLMNSLIPAFGVAMLFLRRSLFLKGLLFISMMLCASSAPVVLAPGKAMRRQVGQTTTVSFTGTSDVAKGVPPTFNYTFPVDRINVTTISAPQRYYGGASEGRELSCLGGVRYAIYNNGNFTSSHSIWNCNAPGQPAQYASSGMGCSTTDPTCHVPCQDYDSEVCAIYPQAALLQGTTSTGYGISTSVYGGPGDQYACQVISQDCGDCELLARTGAMAVGYVCFFSADTQTNQTWGPVIGQGLATTSVDPNHQIIINTGQSCSSSDDIIVGWDMASAASDGFALKNGAMAAGWTSRTFGSVPNEIWLTEGPAGTVSVTETSMKVNGVPCAFLSTNTLSIIKGLDLSVIQCPDGMYAPPTRADNLMLTLKAEYVYALHGSSVFRRSGTGCVCLLGACTGACSVSTDIAKSAAAADKALALGELETNMAAYMITSDVSSEEQGIQSVEDNQRLMEAQDQAIAAQINGVSRILYSNDAVLNSGIERVTQMNLNSTVDSICESYRRFSMTGNVIDLSPLAYSNLQESGFEQYSQVDLISGSGDFSEYDGGCSLTYIISFQVSGYVDHIDLVPVAWNPNGTSSVPCSVLGSVIYSARVDELSKVDIYYPSGILVGTLTSQPGTQTWLVEDATCQGLPNPPVYPITVEGVTYDNSSGVLVRQSIAMVAADKKTFAAKALLGLNVPSTVVVPLIDIPMTTVPYSDSQIIGALRASDDYVNQAQVLAKRLDDLGGVANQTVSADSSFLHPWELEFEKVISWIVFVIIICVLIWVAFKALPFIYERYAEARRKIQVSRFVSPKNKVSPIVNESVRQNPGLEEVPKPRKQPVEVPKSGVPAWEES